MIFPKVRKYSDVFNQKITDLEIIDGTCIYCRRRQMPLVLDAHNLWSCPECLALDLYLLDTDVQPDSLRLKDDELPTNNIDYNPGGVI